MRIGIEAQRLFREKKHGVEIVALELIRCLQRIDIENEYVIFVRKDIDNKCISATKNFKICEIEAGSYPEWEQIKLPSAVKREKIDLLHCTANTAPLFVSVPVVLTLHDIIFMEKTDFSGSHYQNFGNLYRRLLLPRILKKIKKIITVSEFEKEQITNHLKTDPNRLEVVYNAVDSSFRKIDKGELVAIQEKYLLPEKFILFFGSSAEKKNSAETVKGYLEYAKKSSDPIPLVIAGGFEIQVKEMLESLNLDAKIRALVITLGYISFYTQPSIYNLAHLFLYTSKRESFGMPILESMACGTPVITSNTSSMPEIAGNAAHLVDPYDKMSIAEGIEKVVSDNSYYDQLTNRGLKRITSFNWENSARQIIRIYADTLLK